MASWVKEEEMWDKARGLGHKGERNRHRQTSYMQIFCLMEDDEVKLWGQRSVERGKEKYKIA